MENSETPTALQWGSSQSAKEKTAVLRNVNALLDALAPERALKRADAIKGPVDQHRTPNGCVLQGQGGAVSVSWFLDSRSRDTLGELHVNVWRGVVSRGGSSYRKAERATLVSELVLTPITGSLVDCVWRAEDGTEYDTASLVTHCTDLLQGQVAAAG
ncbi:MAG: hypothetical protein ABI556_04125 [Gemmatimonadales bacterium]